MHPKNDIRTEKCQYFERIARNPHNSVARKFMKRKGRRIVRHSVKNEITREMKDAA